jgi:putative tricarboxylic transport membrane protein
MAFKSARAAWLAVGLALALTTAGCSGDESSAEDTDSYPSKRIDLVVWSEAGGSGDTNARVLAPLLEKELGQTVVVSNMSGGGGVEAVKNMLARPADGYTLVSVSGTLAVLFDEKGVDFKIEDMHPLVQTEQKPFAIYVSADSPYQTIKDLAESRASADDLHVTGVFPIGGYRFAWERFAQAAGLESTWIPFDGAPEAVAAVAGGKAEAGVGYAGNLIPQVDAKKIRVLAVASEERLEAFPDVPTLAESGFDVVDQGYNGIIMKAGTPQEITAKLVDAFKAATSTEEWRTYLEGAQSELGSMDPDAYQAVLQRDAKFTAELKAELGLR